MTLCYELNQKIDIETNNNHLLHLGQEKEDLDPNIGLQRKKGRKSKNNTKQCQITSSSAYISENGVYHCLNCDKTFNKSCYLTQHNKSFHSGDKPFKCAQCGKRFSSEERHKKHTEMHDVARKHQCTTCPKLFAHKTDLKRHLCVHTGRRPFKCDTCGKGFIRHDHMKKHQDTHTRRSRINNQRQAQRFKVNARVNGQRSNLQRFNIQRFPFNVNIKL